MLDKWSKTSDLRSDIGTFWKWLSDSKYWDTSVFDIDIYKALNEYLEIDTVQLEKERRQLLNQIKPIIED